MLHTLLIDQLALIESAELVLCPGLNVFSGETGGGKSLLINALKLIAGERASAGMIRHGQAELSVHAEFRLHGRLREAVVGRLLDLTGHAPEDDLLLLTRIVDRQGRSRVRIGGRPATLAALREVAARLLEIHGQDIAGRGEAQGLTSQRNQAELLDRLAGSEAVALQQRFADRLQQCRQLAELLRQRDEDDQQRRQRLEFLRFQVREMQGLELGQGELDRLQQEHQALSHVDVTRQRLMRATALLQDDETSASDLLAQAARAVREAAAHDTGLAGVQAQLDTIEELVSDACRELQSRLAGLEDDPGRLAAVESRLDEVHRLLRRFGPTPAEFFANLARAAEELDELEVGDEPREALAERLAGQVAELGGLGRELATMRRQAGGRLGELVARELADLGMPHTVLRLAMAEDFDEERLLAEATPMGPVPLDLEVRINPGEPFRSMRETASGGELARIVLAVKKTLAERDDVPLLVLDEIDAEIGGRLGQAVGRKLREVSAHRQVVVVTHLPQVASFAERHFLIAKQVVGSEGDARTASSVRALDAPEIERELSAMGGLPGPVASAPSPQRRNRSLPRRRNAQQQGSARPARQRASPHRT
jgi:DNA repair protein RecN (Recombination protein N)